MNDFERKMMASATNKVDAIRCDSEKVQFLRENLTWGTFGRQGEHEKPVKKSLNNLDTNHIENIMITQRHYDANYAIAFLSILKERYQSGKRFQSFVAMFFSFLAGLIFAYFVYLFCDV